MKYKVNRKILLNPGPATTTETVKYAQVVPDICPREKEFLNIMSEVRQGLLRVVGAGNDYTCILLAGSGTAAMDATINSVVPLDKKILIINNGAYGERMVKIAKAYNIDCVELKFHYTERPDLIAVEKALNDDTEISHVAMVHHETTTGMLNPVREIGEIAHSIDRLVIADTISSFAGIPIDIKKDHIDYLMSTSNKCIQGMAGLCFVICKKSEIEKTANRPPQSFYLNLYQQYKYFEELGEMRFTPPVQVLYALKQAIKEYVDEGGNERFKRYKKNWNVLTKGLKEMDFELLLDDNLQSNILTTIIEPDHPLYDFNTMHDLLYDKGFTIYPGKIAKEGTFRIANMGAIDHKDIEQFLIALKKTLNEMGIMQVEQSE